MQIKTQNNKHHKYIPNYLTFKNPIHSAKRLNVMAEDHQIYHLLINNKANLLTYSRSYYNQLAHK